MNTKRPPGEHPISSGLEAQDPDPLTLGSAPLKGDRALLELPFFSLEKQPRKTPLVFEEGSVQIRVEPGMATMWDKDVLHYCASLLNEQLERGAQAPIDRTITFRAHDFLTVARRGTGQRSYKLFVDALTRLRSTTILTNVKAAGRRERAGFGWIDNFQIIEQADCRGRMRMAAVAITLNNWLFRALVEERRVLSINSAYFSLRKSLERRLYELARKHCGNQPKWTIGIGRLARKCGSSQPLRAFRADLQAIINSDSLPDYKFGLAFEPSGKKETAATFGEEAGRRYKTIDGIVVVFEPRAVISVGCESDRNIADI